MSAKALLRIIAACTALTCLILQACNRSKEHSASSTRPASRSAERDIRQIWRDCASEARLPESTIALVSRLIREHEDPAARSLPEADADRLSWSLRRFLGQFRGRWADQRSNEKASYWVAWLLLESRTNLRTDPTVLSQGYASMERLCDEVVVVVIRRKLEGIREAIQHREGPEGPKATAEALARLRARLMRQFEQLRDDPLYPALHGIVPEAARESVRRFLEEDVIIQVGSLNRMTTTNDEVISRKVRNYLRDVPERVLFDVTRVTILGALNKTSYWGFMKYSGSSCSGTWPIAMGFVPDDAMNKARGWSRNEEGPR